MMALLAAMSVIVGGDVFWQLRSIGTALAPPGDQIAAEETQLSNELGFGKKLESVSDWEASLPSDFTGTRREYAAAIAESQLGYTETDGYTRYGDWFGSPYGEWNIAFVHFVMHYAGVAGYEIPYASSCSSWFRNLQSRDLLLTADSGFPERGDVLLTDLDADGVADRAGIIAAAEDSLQVTVIEGNLDGAVGETSYAWDDSCICGWVSLDEPDTVAETAVPDEAAGKISSDETEFLYFEAVSESGITVSAKTLPDVFPDGTAMTVHDLPKKDAVMAAEAQFAADRQLLDAVAVDITFTDPEGNELEPAGDAGVQVKMTLPPEKQLEGTEFSLMHISDDGIAKVIPDADVTAEGASFTAESFSIYIVTGGNNGTIQVGTGTNTGNSANNPYVMSVGDTVRVIGRSQLENRYVFSRDQDVINSDGRWFFNNWQNGEFVTEGNFTALKEGITRISLEVSDGNYEDFYVQVVKPTFVIKTTYGTCVNTPDDRNAFYPAGTGGDNNEFYVNNNNVFQISYTSSEQLNDWGFWTSDTSVLNFIGGKTVTNENGLYTYTQTVQAVGNGSAIITFADPTKDTIKITVSDSQHMTVETALDERDVDKVNEWLDNPTCDFMDNHDQDHDGYIPNYIAHWNEQNQFTNDYDANSIAAYMMYDGVPAEFYYPSGSNITYAVSKLDVTHSKTQWSNRDGQKIDGILPASASEASVTQTQTEDGRTHFSISINTTGFYAFTVLQNGKPVRTIYLYGIEPSIPYPYGTYWPTVLQHSDMEIADGGIYTFTEYQVDSSGNVTTIIRTYDASVSRVNYCKMRGDLVDEPIEETDPLLSTEMQNELSKENRLPIYQIQSNGDSPAVDWNGDYIYTGNEVNFDSDLYVKNPGETTQLEWTSNPYIAHKDFQHFEGSTVKQVVFDVDLKLELTKVTTISPDGSTTVLRENDSGFVPATEVRNNVIYTMNQQDIIDALNKCPNHSGFDFTARSNAAMISFKAKKELSGYPLESDMFNFEMVEKTGEGQERQIMPSVNEPDPVTISVSQNEEITVAEGQRIILSEPVSKDRNDFFRTTDNEIQSQVYVVEPNVDSLDSSVDKKHPVADNDNLETHTAVFTASQPGTMKIISPSGKEITVHVAETNSVNENVSDVEELYVVQGRSIVLYEDVPKGSQGVFKKEENGQVTEFNDMVESINDSTDRHKIEFTPDVVGTKTIVSPSGKRIVLNVIEDQVGTVSFNNIRFEHEGEYTYEMREVIPLGDDRDDTIYYDDSVYSVTVKVEKDPEESSSLIVKIKEVLLNGQPIKKVVNGQEKTFSVPDEYLFSNSRIYHLPATGGIGIVPFMVGGGSMMTAALWLMLRKRKGAFS